MNSDQGLSRRQVLAAAVAGSALAGLNRAGVAAPEAAQAARTGAGKPAPFRFCLNTGTIRGLNLKADAEIEVAAKAGYDAVEVWIDRLNAFTKDGGSLKDLGKKIAGLGLTVEGAISFPRWAVDDDAQRAQALEQIKREMALVAEIGAKRIAAPPSGVNNGPALDLMKAAERYRAVLELGDQSGVTPELELWGASKNLSRLGEGAFVAIESGHPKACLLPDVFHIYKSGGGFEGIKLLSNRMIQVFHLNDYPAEPPREKARDSDRVWPGDGLAPLTQILRDLAANGGGQVLSVELFNPNYLKNDALTVAKTGVEKMKAAVRKALG